MNEALFAKVAVENAVYHFDKLFTYRVPEHLRGQAVPGARVSVPFGAGNRRRVGLVFSLSGEGGEKVKDIDSVLDREPALSPPMLELARWLKERYYCTLFEAVKLMIPAGIGYKIVNRYRISAAFKDYDRTAYGDLAWQIIMLLSDAKGGMTGAQLSEKLGIDEKSPALRELLEKGIVICENAASRNLNDATARMVCAVPDFSGKLSPKQQSAYDTLCAAGTVTVRELCYYTGVSTAVVKALCEKGAAESFEVERFRRPKVSGKGVALPEALSPEQARVAESIVRECDMPTAAVALLYGITGSGKTAVFMHVIRHVLAQGRGVIVTVPEISLTPQMIEAFSAYFGDAVAVLHSGLPLSERYDEWKRIRAGLARVVVGTRSAVFAPMENLGLLIIDEEQEDTYKSESTPRYHARDVAKFRCAQHRALLLLGSATPDVVSRYYAETGRYHYFTLPDRFNARKLPDVIIADMKQELRNGNSGSISSVLYAELEENLRRGEQSILFLNRRGASKLVTCAECGATYSCPNCSVSLTYHQGNQMLVCHHCGYRQRVDDRCPVCGGELRFLGDGTERIEADVHALFPGVETLRMDADAIAMAGTHEALLQRFVRERIPIMIGTQMITKGLNFENVTLVGVLNADQSLYVGDYRANERTFSLITQVVGRSGRGDAPGRAVIQTFTPANETIRQAARQDYDAFYRSEIALRQLNGTPPFSEVLAVTVSGAQENAVVRCCAYIRDYFRQTVGERAEVLGPAPLPVVRMNNRYRYRVTLYCNQSKAVRRAAANIVMYCNTEKSFRDVTVFADDNPLD